MTRAACVLHSEQGTALVIREKTYWNVPGGKIKYYKEESLWHCAQRETIEEGGGWPEEAQIQYPEGSEPVFCDYEGTRYFYVKVQSVEAVIRMMKQRASTRRHRDRKRFTEWKEIDVASAGAEWQNGRRRCEYRHELMEMWRAQLTAGSTVWNFPRHEPEPEVYPEVQAGEKKKEKMSEALKTQRTTIAEEAHTEEAAAAAPAPAAAKGKEAAAAPVSPECQTNPHRLCCSSMRTRSACGKLS